MVSFMKMWSDLNSILDSNDINNCQIIEHYEDGFSVKSDNVITFISKDDLVDCWCRMLYYNEVSKEQMNDSNSSKKCVYDLLKNLPYISDCGDALRVTQ